MLDHQKHTCWSLSIETWKIVTNENKDMEMTKLLETLQQIEQDGICLQYVKADYLSGQVELEKELLDRIQSIEHIDFKILDSE